MQTSCNALCSGVSMHLIKKMHRTFFIFYWKLNVLHFLSSNFYCKYWNNPEKLKEREKSKKRYFELL